MIHSWAQRGRLIGLALDGRDGVVAAAFVATLRGWGGIRARRVRQRSPQVRRTEHVGETEAPDRGMSSKESARYDQGTEQRSTGRARTGPARPGGRRDRGQPARSESVGVVVPRAPGGAGRRFDRRSPASRTSVAAVDDCARHRTLAPASGEPPLDSGAHPARGRVERAADAFAGTLLMDGREALEHDCIHRGTLPSTRRPRATGRLHGLCDRTIGSAEVCSLLTPRPLTDRSLPTMSFGISLYEAQAT